MKRSKIILTLGIGSVLIGVAANDLLINQPIDFTKCGGLTGQVVDIQKQEIRQKFAFCKEELIIKKSDIDEKIGSELTKEAAIDADIKSASNTTTEVDIDSNGSIITSTVYGEK